MSIAFESHVRALIADLEKLKERVKELEARIEKVESWQLPTKRGPGRPPKDQAA